MEGGVCQGMAGLANFSVPFFDSVRLYHPIDTGDFI